MYIVHTRLFLHLSLPAGVTEPAKGQAEKNSIPQYAILCTRDSISSARDTIFFRMSLRGLVRFSQLTRSRNPQILCFTMFFNRPDIPCVQNTRLSIPNWISIGSAVLHNSRHGQPLPPPQNCLYAWGSGPPSNTCIRCQHPDCDAPWCLVSL